MVYEIQHPKGIDQAINRLQKHLSSNLKWQNIDIYGRVYNNPSKEKGKVTEAYLSDGEYREVSMNDSVNATIFFIEDDTHETKNGIQFTNNIKIVFAVNLKKLFTNIVHRADMEAEIKAIEVLRNRAGFSMATLEKGVDTVMKNFNTDGIKLSDMQPYHVFSINGTITYNISCITN